MTKKVMYFKRNELYDLVWTRPVRELAAELGISDVGLSKACRRANIPRPGLGYWAKKTAGKPTLQAMLPERGLGESDEVRIGGNAYWYEHQRETDEEILNTPVPPRPTFPTGLAEVTAKAKSILGKVRVPANLNQGHRLIVELLKDEDERRERQKTSPYPSTWDAPRFDSPTDRRRLRLLNALFLALARCGYRPTLLTKDQLEPGVQVGGQHVRFTMEPTTVNKSRSNRAGKPGRIPRAKLTVAIGWWRDNPPIPLSWEDTDAMPLEAQLTDVAVGLLVAGEWAYRTGLEHQYEWRLERKRDLEERIRKAKEETERRERERLRQIEEERRKVLLAEVAAWNLAAEIRRYVQAVTTKYHALEDHSDQQLHTQWVVWALSEADRLDPIKQDSRRNRSAQLVGGIVTIS